MKDATIRHDDGRTTRVMPGPKGTSLEAQKLREEARKLREKAKEREALAAVQLLRRKF